MNTEALWAEIRRNMGCHTLDSQTQRLTEQALTHLQAQAAPKRLWRMFPITWQDHAPLLGATPLEGQDIRKHLQGCEAAVIMGATLSFSAETALRRMAAEDMALAVVADAVAAAMVEQLCEETEQEIRSHVPYLFVTQRFSPGYGDLPLHTQPALLRMLDADRTLGITATAQHILLPQKSVTAVLGCSHSPVQDARKGICGVNCKGCPHEDTCPSRCSTAEN